jgi:antirestriction protein ArdC
MSNDPELAAHVSSTLQSIAGTDVSWQQPTHILPIDLEARRGMEEIVASFEESLATLTASFPHVPSRARSLVWIAAAIPVLRSAGLEMPDAAPVLRKVHEFLHQAQTTKAQRAERRSAEPVALVG